ncbi:hypothetical protein AYJ57_09435 [Salipiger sp. CCB-MM3]|uniref:BLUF domain-containing protein n=1 Tax=Salipiger sp. CCB-MM3 TaxID=1792508 RepID=UPI00080AB454|nr:BLUF domain-containing protein [Salipiger sp. CCB-MM3]ANT60565.1 hypothetical protein AYJ57_09435 [Salipiger sp. CCB-MM3]
MIYQLLYTSRSLFPRRHPSDVDIMTKALDRNLILGVTGCLLREEGGFCQVLEGARSTVRGLFEEIRQDSRHFSVVERVNRHVTERMFPRWSMAYGTLSMEDRAYLARLYAGEGRNLSVAFARVQRIAGAA